MLPAAIHGIAAMPDRERAGRSSISTMTAPLLCARSDKGPAEAVMTDRDAIGFDQADGAVGVGEGDDLARHAGQRRGGLAGEQVRIRRGGQHRTAGGVRAEAGEPGRQLIRTVRDEQALPEGAGAVRMLQQFRAATSISGVWCSMTMMRPSGQRASREKILRKRISPAGVARARCTGGWKP